MTTVVNIRKDKSSVYIGRPPRGSGIPDPPLRGCFGNPFVMGSEADREKVVLRYEVYFLERIEADEAFRKAVLELRGKALGCFCKPKLCHGDVIANWLNHQEKLEGASRGHSSS